MYERIGGFTATRKPLPSGDAGTRTTLAWMQRFASEGARDVEVRSAAIQALDAYGAASHDAEAALAAVFKFVRDRIRFVHDPVGVQAVQSPRATLELGAGNCAQRATLLAAMVRAIGIPAALKFRVIAARPGSRAFSHVFVVATLNGRAVALDPTYQRNRVGDEYMNRTRVGDYRL